ncbi:hypothetical protein BUE80_DR013537 [Diplocarpon rosae]|nr:hypothetical protein BUE80_DR013537 [Diplocarpon rosae]
MQLSVGAVALMASAVSAGYAVAPPPVAPPPVSPAPSVVYHTEQVTITSCAPTVVYCPAESTVISTTSYPVAHTPHPPPVASSTDYHPVASPSDYHPAVPTYVPAVSTYSPAPSSVPVPGQTNCSSSVAIPSYHPSGEPSMSIPSYHPSGEPSVSIPSYHPSGEPSMSVPPYNTSTAIGIPSHPATYGAPPYSVITISTCIPTLIYSTVTPAPSAPMHAPVPSTTKGMYYPAGNHTMPNATASVTPSNYVTGGASSTQVSWVPVAIAGLAAFIFA